MSLKLVSPGNAPEDINVIIEIPAFSKPVKYEVCKETGAICVDRFLSTPMYYPCNYGYVPGTLADDGDPVDVLVVAPARLMPGIVIRVRPVGKLNMKDESGEDTKILAVPVEDLTSQYNDIKTYEDLPKPLLDAITHFFEHYKDLEPNKWVSIANWEGPEAAKQDIMHSIEHYNEQA